MAFTPACRKSPVVICLNAGQIEAARFFRDRPGLVDRTNFGLHDDMDLATFLGSAAALAPWFDKMFLINRDHADASAVTLLALIAAVEDTNMIRRGGLEAARNARSEAQTLLPTLTRKNCTEVLARLDQQYIAAHLSPGGCADLLAVSLMLLFLQDEN